MLNSLKDYIFIVQKCNLINITVLRKNIAGKSHIWECGLPPNRLGGITTVWERLAEIGNVKASYEPNKWDWSNSQEWSFKDGYKVNLNKAILNHRQRIYVASHLLNSENFAPYMGKANILVPADPNGSRNNSSTTIYFEEANAYPLHLGIFGSSVFKGAKENLVELSSKLGTRLDETTAIEYCGITPFDALGVKIRLKHYTIKCFQTKEFDREVCFKGQSGKLTYEIPRDMAKDTAALKFNQLNARAGPSGRTQWQNQGSDSIKVNRALLTKGTNCTEWKLSKHRKLNPTCLKAQMENSKTNTSKQGNYFEIKF